MMPKGGFAWAVILIVALLVFGPKSLPKLGKSLGSTVKNLREGMEEGDEPEETTKSPKDDDAEIRALEAKLAAAKKKKAATQEEQDAE